MISRENTRRAKHKSPKFKKIYDEDIEWEDKVEQKNRKKKRGRNTRQKNHQTEKW